MLYKDGMLKFFENPESHMAEEVFNLKRDLVKLEDGSAVSEFHCVYLLRSPCWNGFLDKNFIWYIHTLE